MDDEQAVEREERAVYAIIILALTPVIVAVAMQGGAIDGGNTLCLVLAAIAIAGLLWRRSSPVPCARVVTPRNVRR